MPSSFDFRKKTRRVKINSMDGLIENTWYTIEDLSSIQLFFCGKSSSKTTLMWCHFACSWKKASIGWNFGTFLSTLTFLLNLFFTLSNSFCCKMLKKKWNQLFIILISLLNNREGEKLKQDWLPPVSKLLQGGIFLSFLNTAVTSL